MRFAISSQNRSTHQLPTIWQRPAGTRPVSVIYPLYRIAPQHQMLRQSASQGEIVDSHSRVSLRVGCRWRYAEALFLGTQARPLFRRRSTVICGSRLNTHCNRIVGPTLMKRRFRLVAVGVRRIGATGLLQTCQKRVLAWFVLTKPFTYSRLYSRVRSPQGAR